jgi:hypothetical protein
MDRLGVALAALMRMAGLPTAAKVECSEVDPVAGAPLHQIATGLWPRAILIAGLLLAHGAPPVRSGLPEGGAVDPAREAWIPALLGRSVPARFQALDEMRADPELARQALLLAVSDPAPLPERWRLIRHLAEFGMEDDIPALLAWLEKESDPMERRFVVGTAHALYPRYDPPADLARAAADFIFLQTRPPQPYDREGLWALTPRTVEEHHRGGVPIDVIAALQPLRDRAFPDRAALVAAMQRALAPADWRAWQETLLAPLAPFPPRVMLEGILRVRLVNPADRPLLVRIGFGIWRARFESDPPPGFLYIRPGEEGRYEVTVRPIAPLSPNPVRIDLRLREAHRPAQPLYRKLIIPTMP